MEYSFEEKEQLNDTEYFNHCKLHGRAKKQLNYSELYVEQGW